MDIISYPDVKKIKYIFLNTVHIYEQKHKNRTRVIVLNFLGSLIMVQLEKYCICYTSSVIYNGK